MNQEEFQLDTVVYSRFEILDDTFGCYTVNVPYSCQKCGNCCLDNTFPGDKQDLQYIAGFLNTTSDKLITRYTSNMFHDYPCVFYEKNQCTVYPVRPAICRAWYYRATEDEDELLKCPAFSRQNAISKRMIEGRSYRPGIREILYIGKNQAGSTTPNVGSFDEIQEKSSENYYSPDEDQARRIWMIFNSFKPGQEEKKLFFALNPVLSKLFEL